MRLDVDSLSFSYGGNTVLKNITFNMGSREMVFLLGGNGAGKSTLFKCILGQCKPKSGRVLLDGMGISDMTSLELAKKIAYIPQAVAPTFHYPVIQMVLMGRTAHLPPLALPRQKDYDMAYESLKQLHIEHLADKDYSSISGGERQLVLIARALVQDGKILIMDEPTASLDYGNQLRVLEQVKSLAEDGHTILISSHNPQHALLFGDRVLALSGGIIEAEGEPESVLSGSLFRRLYNMEASIVNHAEGKYIMPKLLSSHIRANRNGCMQTKNS